MTLQPLARDRALAVRPRCALDVRTPVPPEHVQTVPQRRSLGPAGWFFAFVIVFMSAGALATSVL